MGMKKRGGERGGLGERRWERRREDSGGGGVARGEEMRWSGVLSSLHSRCRGLIVGLKCTRQYAGHFIAVSFFLIFSYD